MSSVSSVSSVTHTKSLILASACERDDETRGLPTCADAAGLAFRAIGKGQTSLRPRRTPSTLLAEAAPAG